MCGGSEPTKNALPSSRGRKSADAPPAVPPQFAGAYCSHTLLLAAPTHSPSRRAGVTPPIRGSALTGVPVPIYYPPRCGESSSTNTPDDLRRPLAVGAFTQVAHHHRPLHLCQRTSRLLLPEWFAGSTCLLFSLYTLRHAPVNRVVNTRLQHSLPEGARRPEQIEGSKHGNDDEGASSGCSVQFFGGLGWIECPRQKHVDKPGAGQLQSRRNA
jgi:hypothetical protein